MKDRLRQALDNDLKIKKFEDESECEYNQRLIYTAGASWVKTLVYGHSYSDIKFNDNFVNTDIMYVETHLAKVLEAYLKCFDINLEWNKGDSNFKIGEYSRNFASHLIKEVIYTYNLAEILSRRITPVSTSFYKYANDLYLVRGNVLNEKNVQSVGVAQWKRHVNVGNYIIDKKIVDVTGKDYYRVMKEEFVWKESKLNGEYLIFKLGSKGAYSKCWEPISINEISYGINIIKLVDKFNGGYILVKKNEDNLQIAELEPWYIKEKEIYRILYALNYENGTPAEFSVKKKKESYILRCSGALPKYEDRILTCCSWPYMTFDDKYSRIVPQFLWDIVEKQISELGIRLIG